jgi:hypothetical protein
LKVLKPVLLFSLFLLSRLTIAPVPATGLSFLKKRFTIFCL